MAPVRSATCLVVVAAALAMPRDGISQSQPLWAFSAGAGTATGPGAALAGSIGLTVTGVAARAGAAQGIGFWYATRDRLVVVASEASEVQDDIPTEYALDQNYPNPFNPSTRIRFAVPEQATVRLVVHNVLGQLVAEIVHAEYKPGYYNVDWAGRDRSGAMLPSGLYFYTLRTKAYSSTRKMVLQK
jgi:hypothetical protein